MVFRSTAAIGLRSFCRCAAGSHGNAAATRVSGGAGPKLLGLHSNQPKLLLV